MINSEQVRELFPFSIGLDTELRVTSLGRSLHKRLGDSTSRLFSDLFELPRWIGAFDTATLDMRLGRPVIVATEQGRLLLMGAFARIGEGYLFLGVPSVERLEELAPLGLAIDDFAAHDGIMNHLFLLQRNQANADQGMAAARELVTRARSYKQLVEQSNDIILSVRNDGMVGLANPAAHNLLGPELANTSVEKLLSRESRQAWTGALSGLVEGNSEVWVELSFRGHDGDPIIVEGHMVRSEAKEDEDAVLAFLRDVTEKTKVQSDLDRSTVQLRQWQKMEAIGRLAGGIAHDFNNLLSVIIGAGNLLKDDIPTTDPRRDDVDLVLLSAEKGAALARQLLLFSRGEPSSDARTEVVRQTQGLIQILTRIIGKRVSLDFQSSGDPIHVALEPGQFEQILMNLVINARDAMPEGGTVRITIAPLPDNQGALLEVTDSGTGMTEEVAQKIFEPFYTTKEAGSGTGLGLSVVYGIVTGIRGEIHVDSAPGQGTTFSMRLPGVAPASPDRSTRASPSSTPELIPGNPRVVLLEDNADLRRLTTRGLEQMGFEVYPCASIAEARAEFEMLSGAPDLLVTDVMLEDGNGLDLAEELAAKGQTRKAVITTGHANLERIDGLILQHGWRLLMKPFSPRQLSLVVSQVMSGL